MTLAITNYNRDLMTVNAFRLVHDDPRIEEIIIVDDHSDERWYNNLLNLLKGFSKVKAYRNYQNIGMGANKALAVSYASCEWVILFDSDNELRKGYLDSLDKVFHQPATCIYMPSFAQPTFDYREFSSLKITRHNVAKFIEKKMFDCLLNTCNYVVNKTEYLKVYQDDPSIKGTDTIAFNYRWLLAGNSFYVVPGMNYFHRVHSGSGYLADAEYNMKKSEEFKQKIKCL